MEIEIKNTKENSLLHRNELEFLIQHLGEGSPNRLEVRDKLAAMETADPKLTFIVHMKPRFGVPEVRGKARIYADQESADRIELNYVKIRNLRAIFIGRVLKIGNKFLKLR